jgi:hypothetical protein
MQLYAVREIDERTAIGIFYAHNVEGLAEQVMPSNETFRCEYAEITEPGGITWSGDYVKFGHQFPDTMPMMEIATRMERGLGFDGSLDALVGGLMGKLEPRIMANMRWQPLDPDQKYFKRYHAELAAEMAKKP